MKVNFYTFQTKTKTEPCGRQKRHCKNVVVSTTFDLRQEGTFWASSLSVKARQFVAGSQFCPQHLGQSELSLGRCGICLWSPLQKRATEPNSAVIKLVKQLYRYGCKTMFIQKSNTLQSQNQGVETSVCIASAFTMIQTEKQHSFYLMTTALT